MSSKYIVEADGAVLAKQLGARWAGASSEAVWKPEVFRRYFAPVVVWADGARVLRSMQQGFYPPYATSVKDECVPNARWEDLLEKPTFRDAYVGSRCLVPMTGFHQYSDFMDVPRWYGWLAPKDGRVGVAAGLWTPWKPVDGAPTEVFATITRDAPDNAMKVGVMRVPVWLPQESWDRWLDPQQRDPNALQEILVAFDPIELLIEQRSPQPSKLHAIR